MLCGTPVPFFPQSLSKCLLYIYSGPGIHSTVMNGVAAHTKFGEGGREDNTEILYLAASPSAPMRGSVHTFSARQHFLQFPLVSKISLLREF